MAFVADNPGSSQTTGTRVMRRLADGTVETLALSPSSTTSNNTFYRSFGHIAINANGDVALRSTFGGSNTGNRPAAIEFFALGSTTAVEIVKDSNGTNAPNGPLSNAIGNPGIGANGNIVYSVVYDNSLFGRELRLSPPTGGGSFTTLATAFNPFNDPTQVGTPIIGSTTFAAFGTSAPLVLDNGDLLLYGNYRKPDGSPSTAAEDGIFRYTAATGTFSLVLNESTSPDPSLRPSQYTSLSNINSFGVIANRVSFPGPDETSFDGLVKYDTVNNTMTLVAQAGTGPGSFESISTQPLILDNGSVVFGATLPAAVEGDPGIFGIFKGPNTSSDKIVALGDTLFGGVLTNLSLESAISSTNTVYISYGIDTNADTFSDQFGIASFVIEDQLAFISGDLNFDGGVDSSDIDPFVLAANEGDLFAAFIAANAAAFELLYPGQTLTPEIVNQIGDINGDGGLDSSDIDPFVPFANNGGARVSAIPEPAGLALLGVAALPLIRRRRR
jgi:MYXO-CTERM domain-containing protein